MQSEIIVRKAEVKDAEAISELVIENAKATLFAYYNPEQWKVFVQYYDAATVANNLAGHLFFCAELNHEIAGVIGLDRNWVVGFYTKATLLNKGIGTTLMNHLENYALNSGISRLKLASSPVGLEYYYKKGWTKIKEAKLKYLGVEFDETLMEKRLSLGS
jgi:N-acetylglutamate synthase-like GNAT family acetyltransferase